VSVPTGLTELMHAVLDGEASESETRELELRLAADPAELTAQSQMDSGVQSALMELKVEYRTVIVLKHIMGCSYEEIGVILEVPEKTVKSRLFTARQALRDVMVQRGLI